MNDSRAPVFLFSGHMIDQPGRTPERFPPRLEPAARTAIGAALDHHGATAGDIAICGGACGGDLLFAEAALERGMALHLQLPFETDEFLAQSVEFAGPEWVERFHRVRTHAQTTLDITDTTPEAPADPDRFATNNLAMLELALTVGSGGEVHFIALWDGQPGDGPGGTDHMVHSVTSQGGDTYLINPHEL